MAEERELTMEVLQGDLDIVHELYTQALHKKEFQTMVVSEIRAENRNLINAVDYTRVCFDPLEAQYIIALILLNAFETEDMIELINGRDSQRYVPIITQECISKSVCYMTYNGVDEVMEIIKKKWGMPLIEHIQHTGLEEIARVGIFKSGQGTPKDCIKFASLFFIYHAVRGAIKRERRQRNRPGGYGCKETDEVSESLL
jgi:hypothetical protein